jgi:hypothetical protein
LTAARWVAQNSLGYKLPCKKGQSIVDGVLFKVFLKENNDLRTDKFKHGRVIRTLSFQKS